MRTVSRIGAVDSGPSGRMPASSAPTIEPADVPTMRSALPGSQPLEGHGRSGACLAVNLDRVTLEAFDPVGGRLQQLVRQA